MVPIGKLASAATGRVGGYTFGNTIGNLAAGRISSTSQQKAKETTNKGGGLFGLFGKGLDFVGKGFAAVGDFLGFDGEFGHDGVGGPTGAGRHLSLAGLGGAVGDVVGLDGQFGQQGLVRPVQTAFLDEKEVAALTRRREAFEKLGEAFGRAGKAFGRVAGPIGAAIEGMWPTKAEGDIQTISIAGEDHLRISLQQGEMQFDLQQLRPGPYGRLNWTKVGDGSLSFAGEMEFAVLADPSAIAERIGRDLPADVIAISFEDTDPMRKGYYVTPLSEEQTRDRPILFGQRRIGPNFSGGGLMGDRSLLDVADSIRDGQISTAALPVRVFEYAPGGPLVAINNRSLGAISEAGRRPSNVWLTIEKPSEFKRLGEAPIFRGQVIPGPRIAVTPKASDRYESQILSRPETSEPWIISVVP